MPFPPTHPQPATETAKRTGHVAAWATQMHKIQGVGGKGKQSKFKSKFQANSKRHASGQQSNEAAAKPDAETAAQAAPQT